MLSVMGNCMRSELYMGIITRAITIPKHEIAADIYPELINIYFVDFHQTKFFNCISNWT